MSNNLTNDTLPDEYEDEYDMYDSCPPIGKETALENVAKITACVLTITISLIGNILIISVTRRTRSMQKIAYNFVVNMAIADLCTTIINMPETLAVEIRDTDEWIPGDVGMVLCKLLPFCQEVCAFCSILSLLAIALDRFFAICFPLKRIMTRRLSKIIIISAWLIPCLASAPMFVANNVVHEDIDGLSVYCVEEWPAPFDPFEASRDYTIILFVLFYMLPLIIISTLYSCVIYKIWRRKTPGNRSTSTNRLYSRSRKKALKMFIAIVVCFTLCWLPYHVVFFLQTYNENFSKCGIPDDLYFMSSFFAHAISALNPCIYMTFNKDYRTGAKRLLASCTRRSNALYPDVISATANSNSRTGVNEDQEMTTFHSRSPRSGIRNVMQRKIHPIDQSIPKLQAYVVNYNHGFAE
ncbi:hypothetical protein OS493_035935 [Desmophyllum pertusum]|uniref:G-protein coupled receptors family 1 profile domain-containing protein n=1 Tax=Desmophyllum pertusum TaxID=174260 RepID=A0A9W9YW59_9CNID|nr:hypothetical protein OS493_035935 [Desmophyllum pertusum]